MPRAKKAVSEARERRAMELAIKGWSYSRIATEIGLADGSGAFAAVQRALAKEPVPDIEEARRIQIERLDKAIEVAFKVADSGIDVDGVMIPTELQLKALDRITKLEERRAKLMGLDAPAKFEGKTEISTPEELMRALDQLAGISPAQDTDE